MYSYKNNKSDDDDDDDNRSLRSNGNRAQTFKTTGSRYDKKVSSLICCIFYKGLGKYTYDYSTS